MTVLVMLCVAILFPLLMAEGMQRVDASHGGVVLGVLPIATALVAVAITHERPRPLFWVAAAVGAGDAFDAGLLCALQDGQPLEGALAFACACGTLSMRAAGGTAAQPTFAEARAVTRRP